MSFSLPYFTHPIVDVATQIYQGEDPWVALGCFLHDWWCHTGEERWKLIATPPVRASTPEGKRWAAFCAATVEELCSRTATSCPEWTNEREYFLAEPWFYYPQPSQREWLLSTTPEPFKRRNIFVGGNVLDNKYELKNQFEARPAWTIWSEQELQNFQETQ